MLNDTGAAGAACAAAGSPDLVDCAGSAARALSTVQDGMLGRDATAANDADGRAGFSFELVAKAGGGHYDKSECVRDAVTGKVWEGKGADGSARPGGGTFHNDSADAAGNDVANHIAEINRSRLCGFADWRLPRAIELQGLVDYGRSQSTGFSIDESWFVHMSAAAKSLWTSDTLGTDGAAAVWTVDFATGATVPASRRPGFGVGVRLVRGGRPPPSGERFTFGGDVNEVHDALTGLTWRRCNAGSVIDLSRCGSGSFQMTHEQALALTRSSGGWRVPNVKELASIVDRSRTPPLAFASAFPNLTTNGTVYWTSTPVLHSPANAYVVGFRDGEVAMLPRTSRAFLLLVK